MTWQPFDSAPRNGTWIMALQNDGQRAYRVSWGRDHKGEMAWCSTERSFGSFGDGLFCMWTLAPVRSAPNPPA